MWPSSHSPASRTSTSVVAGFAMEPIAVALPDGIKPAVDLAANRADIEQVVDHIMHVVKIAGLDHVGIDLP